jgi:hypothetical protein
MEALMRRCPVVGSLILVVATIAMVREVGAATKDWRLNKQSMGNICWVQSKTESQIGTLVSEHDTRKAACQAALDKYDATLSDPQRCWAYAPGTVDRCKAEGITLPKSASASERIPPGRTPLTIALLAVDGDATVRPGGEFRLKVELSRKVIEEDGTVSISIEKQRLVANIGGFPELRPTGAYFEVNPQAIVVKVGKKSAKSAAIRIARQPEVGENEVPVKLPESLLFSAFRGTLSAGFRSCLVLVDPKGP